MSELRVLLGSLLAGVGGAALIAALVLGRGDAAGVLGFESLESEGGVLHTRVEVFERARPPVSTIRALPEEHIREAWIRVDPLAESNEAITATHTPGGVLLERGRIDFSPDPPVGGRTTFESVRDYRVRDWPASRARTLILPVEAGVGVRGLIESQVESGELEQRPGPREGTIMFVGQYSPERSDISANAVTRAYVRDLDAVRIEMESVMTEGYQALSQRYWAVHGDGSRVLVESRLFHYSLLPLSEWDAIEELVFGE